MAKVTGWDVDFDRLHFGWKRGRGSGLRGWEGGFMIGGEHMDHSPPMDTNELFSLYDQEVRIEFTPPQVRREALEHVVRWMWPAPGTNEVIYSRCEEGQVDAVIADQVEYLGGMGRPLAWTVHDHDRPATLPERLIAHGFTLEATESFMALDLEGAPAELLEPVSADVRRITRREQLGDAGAVMKAVWGGDAERRERQLAAELEVPGYASIYVGYADGVPACTGRTVFFPNSHFAVLRGGATRPELRKHGLYTAVLATRVQEAIRRGYRWLTIDASPMSAPIVKKHGFRFLEFVYEHKYSPQSTQRSQREERKKREESRESRIESRQNVI